MRLCRIKQTFLFLIEMCGVVRRMVVGMWKMTRLKKPCITFFGGARLTPNHPYAEHAKKLAHELASLGYSIVTGGGPGIMEAANLGAYTLSLECPPGSSCHVDISSFGIALARINNEQLGHYLHESIIMEHFFERKWLLTQYSVGFAVFPGGFGTLDELFEVLTLIQCDRLERVPLILFGSQYWQPIAHFVEKAVAESFMSEKDAKLIHITDDIEDAICVLHKGCRTHLLAS